MLPHPYQCIAELGDVVMVMYRVGFLSASDVRSWFGPIVQYCINSVPL